MLCDVADRAVTEPDRVPVGVLGDIDPTLLRVRRGEASPLGDACLADSCLLNENGTAVVDVLERGDVRRGEMSEVEDDHACEDETCWACGGERSGEVGGRRRGLKEAATTATTRGRQGEVVCWGSC